MSKLALSAVGLLGVGAGALGAWVVRPPQESASSAAAEQLVVLRDIQRELAAVRQSLATPSLPAVPPQAAAGVAQPEPQVQALVSDLQHALAQLISEGAQLQAAASAGGVVAEGAPRLPANEQAVRQTLALLPAAGAPCFVRELFGLSPAAAYRKFGTPSYVHTETGSSSVYWGYDVEGAPTLTLTFTDGYLSAAKK